MTETLNTISSSRAPHVVPRSVSSIASQPTAETPHVKTVSNANAKFRALFVQIAKYLVVGGLAFVADFSLLYVLAKVVGMQYLMAGFCGFMGGTIVNYLLSIAWVFQHRSVKSKRLEFLLFVAIGLLGLGLNQFILYVGTGVLGFDVSISKLVSVVLLVFWNFGVRKITLFRN